MHPIRLLVILLLFATTAATAQQGSSVYSKAAIDGKVNSLTALTTTHTGQIAGLASVTATLSSVQATQATTIAAHTTAIAAGPPAGSITNARLATAPASTFKGNNTTATAPVSDLSLTDTRIMLGFDQINNTSDAGKPISTATQAAISSLALSSLQSLTSVSAMATRTEATVRYDNSDWKRVTGSITLDNVLYASGGTGFYYARQLVNNVATPQMWQAKADGTTDDAVAIVNSLTACAASGITLKFSGTYNVGSPMSVNISGGGVLSTGGKRLNIISDGQANTCIRYTGTSSVTVLTIAGNYDDRVSITGLRIMPVAANQTLRNSVGLRMEKFNQFSVDNVTVSFFRRGIELINSGEGSMRNVTAEWNTEGIYAAPAGQNAPNAITFTSCAFNSNTSYGAFVENGCTNTFIGCRWLGNGTDATGRGLKVVYAGYSGGVGENLIGNYFENNQGYDVEVITSAGGSHYLAGNTFNKIAATAAVANIKFTALNLVAGAAPNKVTMLANSLWGNASYTPSASRPAIVMGTENAYDGWEVTDENYYQFAVEKPDFTPWLRYALAYKGTLTNSDYTGISTTFTIPPTASRTGGTMPPASGYDNWFIRHTAWIQNGTMGGYYFQEAHEIKSGVNYTRSKTDTGWTTWTQTANDQSLLVQGTTAQSRSVPITTGNLATMNLPSGDYSLAPAVTNAPTASLNYTLHVTHHEDPATAGGGTWATWVAIPLITTNKMYIGGRNGDGTQKTWVTVL